MKLQSVQIILLSTLFFMGLGFRLYHIEFGLPHSFHADEPEIAEFAIKYTFELRSIIENKDYYKLIPLNFVYGTAPTYFFTFTTMVYSKTNNLLGVDFDKTAIYTYLRGLNAIISFIIAPITVFIYYMLLKREDYKRVNLIGLLIVAFLASFNWKFIVHAHYLNVDNFLTFFLVLSYLFAVLYYNRESDTKYTILMGIAFGLAFGTKVTALITLPFYLILFLSKRNVRNMFAFLFVTFGTFVVTNPFSLAFANDFAFRVLMLSVKENGLVFDSADLGVFKYIHGLNFIVSTLVLFAAVYGILIAIKSGIKFGLHFFFFGTAITYLVFYSLGTRRVDRWLLPIIPIVIVYAGFGFEVLREQKGKIKQGLTYALIFVTLVIYSYFPLVLLQQYGRHTPKSAAYVWMRDTIPDSANKLVITKEGLDPMNKLKGVHVLNFQVYESENAQYSLPESPLGYDYVVLSSKPIESFKNEVVSEKFDFYVEAWQDFENTILDPTQFRLVNSYVLPKPNLVELSDVYIYKNLNPIAPVVEEPQPETSDDINEVEIQTGSETSNQPL